MATHDQQVNAKLAEAQLEAIEELRKQLGASNAATRHKAAETLLKFSTKV